ncbi:MAG: SPOR domain-containing protein, partial [Beijerinckiaceae bacterium]
PAAEMPVHPDEFAEVMRSFDRIVERQEPQFQSYTASAQATPAPADMEQELAAMMRESHAALPANNAGGYPQEQAYAPYAEEETVPPQAYPHSVPPVGETRSRRKSVMLAAAVAGVAALGVGGALSFRGGGGVQANGQAPIIRAAEGPTKIAPANPGGADIPDQNRQILERTQGKPPAAAAKVVASEEPPLDLKEAVRRETAANGNAATAVAGAPRVVLSSPIAAPTTTGTTSPANAVEPRKVKTVVIRPETPAPAAAAPVAAVPAPVQSAPAPVAAAPAPKPVENAVATPPATATPAATQAAKPKPKPPVTAEARRTEPARRTPTPAQEEPEATGTANPNAPISIVPTGAPKRNQRLSQVASAQSAAVSDAQPATRSSGSFVVQLASEGTDAEARSAANRFKGRFSELGSFGTSIQQREVNGQMRYRVRFGSMSREEANSLCSSLKGKGQACIIQPN